MKSKYKRLLVSGCSFTYNDCNINEYAYMSWANLLAAQCNIEVINLAVPGAGNTHIANSIMLYIEKHKLDPLETLIIAMWSGIARIDWITDCSLSNFKNNYPWTFNYNEHTELVLGGSWWQPKSRYNAEKTLVEYSKYQSKYSLALHSWLAMNNLSNYLNLRSFEYYYTPYNNDEFWPEYDNILSEMNLNLDSTNWINPSIGQWCQTQNLLYEDNYHPNSEGQITWTNQVLIPYLKERSILHVE